MEKSVRVNGNGIGFGGALTITFIVLKLTGVIDWSWLWVLAPTWIPFAVLLGIFALAGVLMLIAYSLDRGSARRRRRYRQSRLGR